MIGRIIGFSLNYGLGVGSAVLAMVTVLPPLQLGNGVRPDLDSGAQHALYVEGAASCPYLAAVAARSGCPAPGGPAGGTGCPYLDRREGVDGGAPPTTGTPATPEGAAPGPAHPRAKWLPEGTVLALGPAPAGDELL